MSHRPKTSMHEAWLNTLEMHEKSIRNIRHILSANGKTMRKSQRAWHQHQLSLLRERVNTLLYVRQLGKSIARNRWEERARTPKAQKPRVVTLTAP